MFPPYEAPERYEQLRRVEPIPPRWIKVPDRDYIAWQSRLLGLRVIESVDIQRDQRAWLHVSFSRSSRLPSWDDLKIIRQDFISDQRECYSVLPTADRYVDAHPFTLHLWACLDADRGRVLPDFRTLDGKI